MRAAQVLQPTGPADVRVTEVDEPTPGEDEVLIDVHAVGMAFPDLLLSQGQYQVKPDPPFTLGVDVAGTVVSAPESATRLEPGQRVAGVLAWGGAAERAVVPAVATFPIPDGLSFVQGAATGMNYLTAQFALHHRGQVEPGETVLVHGASGGLGTATIQVAKGMGARTIAVCSTEEKQRFAASAGADETVAVDGFKDAVAELTEGRGVDVVVDIVGGEVFKDSLRSLSPRGRLLVLGFASGQGIPEVKVNRLLLNNTDVRGVGWGAYAMARPGFMLEQWAALEPMLAAGTVDPPVGVTYPLEEVSRALLDMAERRALGKLVLEVR